MIKILASLHTMPDVVSYKAMIFRNILPIMREKTQVHVTWLVYMPEKFNLPIQEEPDRTILDIHDYRNAVEIIQKVKPDIIYGSPTLNLPDHALTLAGRFLNIPVVGEIMNQGLIKTDTIGTVKSYITGFFENSVPTDTSEKKQFMRRGRFFIYKYLFLLRTQKAVRMNFIKILESFFILIRAHLSVMKKLYDSYFACTLHFVESEKLIEPLVKDGFQRSSLVVTGIPQYDSAFKRSQKLHPTKKKDDKIRVLLLTHSLFEHGYQTRAQRDFLVKGIVREISKHKSNMSLVVKIHPSSEILSEYQPLIHAIDPTVPIYKNGDVLDFIEEADVIVSYSTSSGPMQAAILKKPIIFCNLFNLEGDVMLERGLAYDCKELSSLVQDIKQILISDPATPQKLDEYFKDIFFKPDGCASERVCNAIFKLLEEQNCQKAPM